MVYFKKGCKIKIFSYVSFLLLFFYVGVQAHEYPLDCVRKRITTDWGFINKKCTTTYSSGSSQSFLTCQFFPDSKDYTAKYHESSPTFGLFGLGMIPVILEFQFAKISENSKFLKARFRSVLNYCGCSLYGDPSGSYIKSGHDHQKALCEANYTR